MARKTKQQALETRQLILDVALRLFSQQGVSSTSLAAIAKSCRSDRGRYILAFQKNKSDLFNEIWSLSDASISDLEVEYRAKFPNDPPSVVREILVYILEATVVEERRRLMMEIIFHKCEFVGEMAVVQQAQRSLWLESYDRIEQTLKRLYHCSTITCEFTHSPCGNSDAQLSFRINGKTGSLHQRVFNLHAEARAYVDALIEMYQTCPSLRSSSEVMA